ncbi:MAG: hypothetical protein QW818_01550 [Candidatus Aenigmatarchaeota archaeon]|nr:hypothetical protein [Candidatus Aenigmarchaeota archaeon]
MQEAIVKYIIWILLGIVGIVITFWVFGAELPLYLILAVGGLIVYIYSENPNWKFIGGFIGRFFATLFIVSLIYYFGTKTFFPVDPFNFKFMKIGLQFTVDFFNWLANFIGKLVLSLIDKIIP